MFRRKGMLVNPQTKEPERMIVLSDEDREFFHKTAVTRAVNQVINQGRHDMTMICTWDTHQTRGDVLLVECTAIPQTHADGEVAYTLTQREMREEVMHAVFHAQCGFGVYFEVHFVEGQLS